MSRYARQEILPEVGTAGQARLTAARVLVVGTGGLGSALLPLLAGAGVGHLTIVDPDKVEEGNLHRQTLYRMADIGRPKAVVAAQALQALNPACEVAARVARLDPALARDLVPGANVTVDAADAFAVTYALSDQCLAMGKPLISASVLGRAGYVAGFCGGAPSCRAVFPDLPPILESCASAGVMGPAVASLGALQAQMVLSVLLGQSPPALGQMLRIDLADWRLSSFRFDAAVEPDAPGPEVISLSDVRPADLVVELRPEAEAPMPAHPQALRLPPETVAPARGQRVVFACATGLRAWRAARALQARCDVPVAILAAGQ
jgi:molybdopterin/thiamine biosynthesis adenylyltransferase